MPGKTKELNENVKIEKEEKKPTTKQKKASVKTKTVSEKVTTKKSGTTKSVSQKKATTNKTKSTSKKTSTKKASDSKNKTSSAEKTSKKTASKKSSTSKVKSVATKRTKKVKPEIVEYYDLPLSYNQTVVKILYQTPTTLFVYWEISEADADNYRKIYGDNFFDITKPVLIVHNDTLNYSFEIDINDFANSWYFNVNDSKSIYRVELGRRPIQYHNEIKEPYIYISSSNTIESPNNKIMFENYLPYTVTFKNVKNNKKSFVSLKDVFKNTSFVNNMSGLYNIKIEDLYKAIYQNNTTSDLYKLINPSSNSSSF